MSFNKERLGPEEALEEAEHIRGRFDEKHPEKEGRFSSADYDTQHHIQEVTTAKKEKGVLGLERELTAEEIEKVMEKVGDPYTYGTAYKFLGANYRNEDRNDVEGALQYGFLGMNKRKDEKDIVDAWERQADADGNKGSIYFNIIGRTLAIPDKGDGVMFMSVFKKQYGSEAEFPRLKTISRYWKTGYPAVLFDVSDLKEMPANDSENSDKISTMEGKVYRNNAEAGGKQVTKYNIDRTPDDHGNMGISPEYGFITPLRIGPETFRGFVAFSEKDAQIAIDAMKKLYGNHVERMLPVYLYSDKRYTQDIYDSFKMKDAIELDFDNDRHTDDFNNLRLHDSYAADHWKLMWPKQMTAEEVRELVKEREKIKPHDIF